MTLRLSEDAIGAIARELGLSPDERKVLVRLVLCGGCADLATIGGPEREPAAVRACVERLSRKLAAGSRLRIVELGRDEWMLLPVEADERAPGQRRGRLIVDTVTGRVASGGVTLWLTVGEAHVVAALTRAGKPVSVARLAELTGQSAELVAWQIERVRRLLPFAFGGEFELRKDLVGAVRLRVNPTRIHIDGARILRMGPLMLDQATGVVTLGGRSVVLGHADVRVLATLMRAQGGVVPPNSVIRSRVRGLRASLSWVSGGRISIPAVPGGYRLAVELGEPYEVGPLRIDPSRRTVELSGEAIALTDLETRILTAVAGRAGTLVPRDVLRRLADCGRGDLMERLLAAAVGSLRRKLECDDRVLLLAVYRVGVGIVFRDPRRRVVVGRLAFDHATATAWVDGAEVPLRPVQAAVLRTVVREGRPIVPWSHMATADPLGTGLTRAAMRCHVEALNRKFEIAGGGVRIVPIRRAGCRLATDDHEDRVEIGPFVIDRFRLTVAMDGRSVKLTPFPIELLTQLARKPSTPEELLDAVGGVSSWEAIRRLLMRVGGVLSSHFGRRVRVEPLPDERWRLVVDPAAPGPPRPMRFGPVVLDSRRHVVSLDGQTVKVGPREEDLFAKLIAAQGAVVRYDELCIRDRADAEPLKRDTAAKTIRQLRTKLIRKFGQRIDIPVIGGEGYRVVLDGT